MNEPQRHAVLLWSPTKVQVNEENAY